MAKLDTRKRGVDSAMPKAGIVARLDMSERCADKVRTLLANQVPLAAVARVLAKAARAVETQTSDTVVDRSVIDDLTVLVETKVAVPAASVDILAKCVDLLVGTQVLGLLRRNPLNLKRREKFNTCGHCGFATFLESRWRRHGSIWQFYGAWMVR